LSFHRPAINLPIRSPFPHPGQARILADPSRNKIVRCGRRYGKTKLGIITTCQVASEDDKRIAWFIPQYKYTTETWRELTQRLGPAIAKQNASEHRIELKNRSALDVWTLENDPKAGRGRFYDLIVVDEAGLVPGLKMWFDMVARATLVDRRGRALFISTPNTIGPDFDEMFEAAESGADSDWKAFTATTFDNPHLPGEELDKIKEIIKTLPEWLAKQEYYAIPAPNAGGFFPRDVIRRMMAAAPEPLYVGTLTIRGTPISECAAREVENVIRRRQIEAIEWEERPDGEWKVWDDDIDRNRRMVMGCDLGAGVGAANTVFAVGDADSKRKSAEFASPGVTPERAAWHAAIGGLWFGGGQRKDEGTFPGAEVQFEINGPGEVFSREMHRLSYPAMCHQSDDPADMATKDPSRFGWRSSPQAKETLLAAYRGALASGRFYNPSKAALAECLTFRYTKTGRLESVKTVVDPADEVARVPHGDRTIADALLWDGWMRAPVTVPRPMERSEATPGGRLEKLREAEKKRKGRFAW
jgi:hypothetical protein